MKITTFVRTIENDLQPFLCEEAILDKAMDCLLDYIGVTFAGAQLWSPTLEHPVLASTSLEQTGTLLGYGKHSSASISAYINGISSHIAELDDGILEAILHPGAPIFSTLFSFCLKKELTKSLFLKSAIIGYEVSARISKSIQPSHKLRGYHATATCGAIGAAASLHYLLNESYKNMDKSISAALIQAGGTLKVLDLESEMKPYNCAHAATSAITANKFGASQFAIPSDVFEGKNGFFSMMADSVDILALSQFKEPAILQTYFKPYAACRYCHAPAEASIKLMKMHEIDLSQIKAIRVETYQLAIEGHINKNVKNMSEAKMSIPFTVATSLYNRQASIAEFTDTQIFNPEVQSLMSVVEVKNNALFTNNYPKYSGASIQLETVDGDVKHCNISDCIGGVNRKMSRESILNKYQTLMDFSSVSKRQSHHIQSWIYNNRNNNKIISTIFEVKDV